MEDQTHIGKLSGNDSGDFPETFAKKKSFSDIVTSLRTIIERGHVPSIGVGWLHLDMISQQIYLDKDIRVQS